MEMSALERLARCAEGTEIWWDSSPLIYEGWRAEFAAKHAARRWPELGRQLEALFHPDGPPYGYLRGATTNQPITLQALEADPGTWSRWVVAAHAEHPEWPPRWLAWATFKEVVRRGAEMLMGIFGESGQRYGYICGQVDPRLNLDTEAMVQQAVDLAAESPNVMVKMPGTAEGIEGVRRLTARGIATTTTLAFTVPQLIAVAEAAEAGLRQAQAEGTDLSRWRCNGVMMLGRFEDHPVLRQEAAAHDVELSPADLRWAGLAVFKRAYRIYRERGYRSKLLAASMRLGPEVDGGQRVWHLEKLAGADTVLTIFPNIIEAFMEHYRDRPLEPAIDEEVPGEVLEKLLRLPYFRRAYEEGGLAPPEFAAYPPVVATADSFTKAMTDFEARVFAFAEGTT